MATTYNSEPPRRSRVRGQVVLEPPLSFNLFDNDTVDNDYMYGKTGVELVDQFNTSDNASNRTLNSTETVWKVLMTNASTLSHPEDSLRVDPVLTFISNGGTSEYNSNPLAMDEPMRSFVLAMYIMIIIVAVLGNAMVIIVHYTLKHGQKDVSTFLVSLALADILLTVFCIPGTMLQITDFAWRASPYLCKPTTFLQTYCVLCSVYTLVIVGIDRLHLIFYPLHRRLASGRTAVRYIGCVWLLLIPVASMQWFVTEIIPYYVDGRRFVSCQENPAGWTHTHALVIFVSTYALPLSLITVIYGTIGWKLWHKMPPGCSLSHNSMRLIKSKQRVVKTLLIIVILFAILWLPLHILNLLVIFVPESSLFRPDTPASMGELASIVITSVTDSSTAIPSTTTPSFVDELLNTTPSNATVADEQPPEEDLEYLIPHIRRYRSLLAPVHILAMMSSCVNPIVYSFSHVPFRKQCIFLFETVAITVWQLIRCQSVTNEHVLRRRKNKYASQRRKYDGYTASVAQNSPAAHADRNNVGNNNKRTGTTFNSDTESATTGARGETSRGHKKHIVRVKLNDADVSGENENNSPSIEMKNLLPLVIQTDNRHCYQNGKAAGGTPQRTTTQLTSEKIASATDLSRSHSFPVHLSIDDENRPLQQHKISSSSNNSLGKKPVTTAVNQNRNTTVDSAGREQSPSIDESDENSTRLPYSSLLSVNSSRDRSLNSVQAADTAALGTGILEMAASGLRISVGTAQTGLLFAVRHNSSVSNNSKKSPFLEVSPAAAAETTALAPPAAAQTQSARPPIQHKKSLLKQKDSSKSESYNKQNRRRRIEFVVDNDGDLDVI